MPQFNKTGPFGEGPMTGRKRGLCAEAGDQQPRTGRFGRGRGYRRRRAQGTMSELGRGRGFNRGFSSSPDSEG